MKKLTLCVGLRHLARFRQSVRLLSLASAYLLLLVLAAPAWSGEKYVKSDSPVFLEATPDRALVYFVVQLPSNQFGTIQVYMDKTPIAFLPRKSYTAVRVEPGFRLVWGTTDSEWFEFKRGRTYLLLYIQSGGYSSGWFMDDPDIIRPLVLQRRLPHVRTPEAGLQRLKAKLDKKYKKALKQAGSKGGVVLPKRFSPASYVAKGAGVKEIDKALRPSGTLTIGENRIQYRSKTKKGVVTEMVIPVSEIQQVSLANLVNLPWVFVRYGRAEAPNAAFFSGGFNYRNHNTIFASIMSAMEKTKRADVQKEPAASAGGIFIGQNDNVTANEVKEMIDKHGLDEFMVPYVMGYLALERKGPYMELKDVRWQADEKAFSLYIEWNVANMLKSKKISRKEKAELKKVVRSGKAEPPKSFYIQTVKDACANLYIYPLVMDYDVTVKTVFTDGSGAMSNFSIVIDRESMSHCKSN